MFQILVHKYDFIAVCQRRNAYYEAVRCGEIPATAVWIAEVEQSNNPQEEYHSSGYKYTAEDLWKSDNPSLPCCYVLHTR